MNVPIGIDFRSIQFGEPRLLWLLVIPAGLLLLWVWQVAIRRADGRRYARVRTVPVRERVTLLGGLLFWWCAIAATSFVIVALARPHAVISVVRTAGVDVVVLQDGSASMHVADVSGGNRWQRSIRFLRTVAESIAWKDDRLALAVFAKIATPQVRLTRDPNTFFFFLDHLDKKSPFGLENDVSWDTNIESGIYWGLRLFGKDQELHGRSKNAKAFILISDGQAWSGEVDRSLQVATARDIPVYVVGVGTLEGGLIPDAPRGTGEDESSTMTSLRARLDRPSLMRIASRTGGAYFELGRGDDRTLANQIVDDTRRRAGPLGLEQHAEELYWRFLATAAAFVCLGALALRERTELLVLALGAAALFQIVASLTR